MLRASCWRTASREAASGSCNQPTGISTTPGGEKDHIPQQVVAVLIDVMDLQDLVVDGAFDQIEEAPAEEDGAEAAPCPRATRRALDRAPQQNDADGHRGPGEGVEEAVPDHVDLLVDERVAEHAVGEHVVQLQDLVKQDAVDEAAHADADDRAGATARGRVVCFGDHAAASQLSVSAVLEFGSRRGFGFG